MNFYNIEGLKSIEKKGELLIYECLKEKFKEIILLLGSDYSYIWLISITFERLNDREILLSYKFANFEKNHFLEIRYKVERGDSFSSIKRWWHNAAHFEEKIIERTELKYHDEYRFRSHSKLATINYDHHQMTMPCNMSRNTNTLNLYAKENEIMRAQLEQGNFYVGLEEILSQSSLLHSYEILESYFPMRGVFYSFLLSKVIEDSLNVDIPDRAKGIRMVIMELHRILDHCLYLREFARNLGNQILDTNMQAIVRTVQALLISYSGNEFGNHAIRAGGVAYDVGQSWSSRVIDDLAVVGKKIESIKDNILFLEKNEFQLRMKVVTKEDVFRWSLTGPLARAAGVNLDLRNRQDLYFYSDIDFSIPLGIGGTLLDILVVRLEEIIQSSRIVVQVLDNLPTGSVWCDVDLLHIPQFAHDKDQNQYKSNVRNYLKLEEFSHIGFCEGPRGIISLGVDKQKNVAFRFDMHAANSALPLLVGDLVVEKKLSEIMPLWSSLDMDLKEIEK